MTTISSFFKVGSVKSFVHYQMKVWQKYIQYVLFNSPSSGMGVDCYGYWTIKFRTKINKLMVQYINITRYLQLHIFSSTLSVKIRKKKKKSLSTVCYVFRFLFSVFESRHL